MNAIYTAQSFWRRSNKERRFSSGFFGGPTGEIRPSWSKQKITIRLFYNDKEKRNSLINMPSVDYPLEHFAYFSSGLAEKSLDSFTFSTNTLQRPKWLGQKKGFCDRPTVLHSRHFSHYLFAVERDENKFSSETFFCSTVCLDFLTTSVSRKRVWRPAWEKKRGNNWILRGLKQARPCE